ncbi:MAG: pitrilysin family protein [Ignavibacteria bacterium]|jgi:zinc protease
MIKINVLFLSIVLFVNITAQTGKKTEINIPYEKYELSNGLDVILHEDHSDPIVAVYVCYHVGSNRETKGHTGFAHLFEHIMFQGTQHVPEDQFLKKIQDAGGKANGYTSFDRTVYYQVVPKNALEMSLWLESDRMGFLLSKLTQESFENQQNVVQNEKRQKIDNVPYGNKNYILNKLMYPETHPYNWQVIGSMEDVSNATLDDVVAFYKNFYGPQNATVAIAGDLDIPQTKEWIEKYFGEIQGGKKSVPLPKMSATLKETKKVYYEDNYVNAPLMLMSFPTVESYNKDSYALQYLASLLTGSRKSPFYKILVEEKKLVPSVRINQNSLEIAGVFNIETTAYPNVDLDDVEDAIEAALLEFETTGFTEKDLERLKNGIEVQFYSRVLSVADKASQLAVLNEFAGSPAVLNTSLNNLLNVTSEDIWKVYKKYIKNQNFAEVCIVPKRKSDLSVKGSEKFEIPEESINEQGTAKGQAADVKTEPIPTKFDRTQEPPKGPYPTVIPPSIWTGKTTNGIEIYGVTQTEVPLINFSIILKGGMLLDPKEKIGTAVLTAALMNQGTKTKTPLELEEAKRDLGISLSVSSGENVFIVKGSCLKNKCDETVKLLHEIMFEPRWDEKEFELIKLRKIQSLKKNKKRASSIADNVFKKLIYGADNILSNSATGTIESIKTVIIDDLKEYYNKYFSSSVAKIIVVGDIGEKDALEMFNTFSDWEAKEVSFPQIEVTPNLTGGIHFIDMDEAKQSLLVIGNNAMPITDPEYYKANLMNYRLGGGFDSYLNMVLREEKGFTYGANSGFYGNIYSGMFRIFSSVQANSTLESIKLIRDIVQSYHNEIKAEDLSAMKKTILNRDALNYETPKQLMKMMLPIILYDYSFDYIKKRQDIVKQITLNDIKELAQKYLLPDKMIYLVVGDKATQFEGLKNLGLGDPVLLNKKGKQIILNDTK